MRRSLLAVSAALAAVAACRPVPPAPKAVTAWATLLYEAAHAIGRPAPEAARANAYASIAIREAYAAEPGSPLRSVGGQLNGLWSLPRPAGIIDGPIAAAEASRTLTDSLLPGATGADSLATEQIALRRRERVRADVSQRSIEYGRALANAILAWSRLDGYAVALRRAQTAKPARTVLTDAEWGSLRTFVLRNGDECAAPPAPTFSTRPGSEYFAMAKALHDSSRTADSGGSSLYWVNDTSSGRSASAIWMRILAASAGNRPRSAPEVADGLMFAAVAIADAEIASRRQRAREAVAPPAAYLKRAIDPKWEPRAATGEFAYPFGPAVISAAAVAAVTPVYGDSLTFVDSTGTGGPISISSLSGALDRAVTAGSRLGVTFPLAEQVAKAQGACIGDKITGRLMPKP